MFTFKKKKKLTNYLYFYNFFLILNVFIRMHVLHAIFFNNLTNYLYIYILLKAKM